MEVHITSALDKLTNNSPDLYVDQRACFTIPQGVFTYDTVERRWQFTRDRTNFTFQACMENTTTFTSGQQAGAPLDPITKAIVSHLAKSYPTPLPLYLRPPSNYSGSYTTHPGAATVGPHDNWVNEAIHQIFTIAACKPGAKRPNTQALSDDFVSDLVALGATPHPEGGCFLRAQDLESAVFEVMHRHPDALVFITNCWKRASTAYSDEPKMSGHEGRLTFLEGCRSLCLNLFKLAISSPGILPSAASPPHQFAALLAGTRAAWAPKDAPTGYYSQIVERFTPAERESGTLKQFLAKTCTAVSEIALRKSIADEFSAVIRAMEVVTSSQDALAVIIQSDDWILKKVGGKAPKGREYEERTILGPIFSIGAEKDEGRERLFAGQMDPQGDITPARHYDRSHGLNPVSISNCKDGYDLLSTVVNPMVRTTFLGKLGRERTLEWFAAVLNANFDRSKIHVRWEQVSSDSFMMNLCRVFLHLVAPIIDPTKDDQMKGKVFHQYSVSQKCRLDLSNITRVYSDTDGVEAMRKKVEAAGEPEYGFITEAFFFAFHGLYLAIHGGIEHLKEIGRTASHIENEMAGGQLAAFQLRNVKAMYNKIMQEKLALSAMLFNKKFVEELFQFLDYAALWLLRVANRSTNRTFDGPLPDEVPEEWKTLPEYCVNLICETVNYYLSRADPAWFPHDLKLVHIPTLCVLLMGASDYVQNPYVREKIPGILHILSRMEDNKWGVTRDLMYTKPMKENLIPSLMVVYVDMENLGGHNQFYEKFTPRYYAAGLLEDAWKLPEYREAFAKEAQISSDTSDARTTRFVKFFNFLLNDANFLLDESLGSLKDIHHFEKLQDNPAEWNKLTDKEKDEKKKGIEESKGRCKSMLQLAVKNVQLMHMLSKEQPGPFLRPELVEKVASNMNYILEKLAGRAQLDYKVRDAESYGFKPKELLATLINTYSHFHGKPEFYEAVAQDGRSYSPEKFNTALQLIRRRGIVLKDEADAFERLCVAVRETQAATAEDDELFEDADIPDEILDPLSYGLLDNPMKLPTSGTIVGFKMIKQSLLNDEIDPFNREHLTIEIMETYNKKPEILEEMAAKQKEVDEWKEAYLAEKKTEG